MPMRDKIATITVSISLLVQSACTERVDVVELIAGFEGGMSVAQAQEVAKRGDRKWLLVNDDSARRDHTYQRWQLAPFEDRNFGGAAELDFYQPHLVRRACLAQDGPH